MLPRHLQQQYHIHIISLQPGSTGQKYAIFYLPHQHLAPPWGWCYQNFVETFCVIKLESLGYRAALCAWTYVAVLIKYRLVTDRWTSRRTDREGNDSKYRKTSAKVSELCYCGNTKYAAYLKRSLKKPKCFDLASSGK